jgi:CRISPR-associated protein Cas1
MKLFNRLHRHETPSRHLPQIKVGIVHLCGPGKLHVNSETLVFEKEKIDQIRLDLDGLREIVAYGEIQVTTSAMKLMQSHQISMSWLSPNGLFILGRLAIDSSDRSMARLLQYQAWEDRRWQLETAREIVLSKLESIQSALRHYQRQGKPLSSGALQKITAQIDSAKMTPNIEQLRGVEGNASALWFGEYSKFFTRDWKFQKRVRGALHEFRSGRLSMACDMMEPFRIPVVDRWVLAVCGQGIFKTSEFEAQPSGGVGLVKEAFSRFLTRFEEHWYQGHFEMALDNALVDWTDGLRSQVTQATSRAASYLKQRIVGGSQREGLGEYESYGI